MGGIASIATEYFKELFSTSSPTRMEEVADLVPRKVTQEMNKQLAKEFQNYSSYPKYASKKSPEL